MSDFFFLSQRRPISPKCLQHFRDVPQLSCLCSTGPPAKVVFELNGPSPRCSSPIVPPPPPAPFSCSSHEPGDEIGNVLRLYRSYADKSLKKLGVTRLLQHMRDLLDQVKPRSLVRPSSSSSSVLLLHNRASRTAGALSADPRTPLALLWRTSAPAPTSPPPTRTWCATAGPPPRTQRSSARLPWLCSTKAPQAANPSSRGSPRQTRTEVSWL